MIIDYASLQTEVEDTLDDTTIAGKAPLLIQLAESTLRRDARIRKLVSTTLTADAGSVAIPASVQRIESLSHTDDRVGPLTMTSIPGLYRERTRCNNAPGTPRLWAKEEDAILFAPASDGTGHELDFQYWSTLERLSDLEPTNWLLEEEPDIYYYAALKESAPWLREDERLAMWTTELEMRIDALHKMNRQRRTSGNVRSRPSRVIGG